MGEGEQRPGRGNGKGWLEGAQGPGDLGAQGQLLRPQADPRPGRGGRGSVCRRDSLTGRECWDTTQASAPVPGTNSKTTCFLLLTPGAQPAPQPP